METASREKKEVSYSLQKWSQICGIIGVVIGLLLSVWALKLTIQTSETATRVDKMDSLMLFLSKQTQNQDSEILNLHKLLLLSNETSNKISTQVKIAKSQSERLFEQNFLTNQLISKSTKQTEAVGQELLFLKRADSLSSMNISLSDRQSLTDLTQAIQELLHRESIEYVHFFKKSTDAQRLSIVRKIRQELETQIKNPMLLKDNIINSCWTSYLRFIRQRESAFVFPEQSNPIIFNKEGDEFEKNYYQFINQMLGALKRYGYGIEDFY